VNRAMFSGSNPYTEAELDGYAQGAVSAFLRGYGPPPPH